MMNRKSVPSESIPSSPTECTSLDYQNCRNKPDFRRRIRLTPRIWIGIALCIAVAITLFEWRKQLKVDEAVFLKHAEIDVRMNFVTFFGTPSAASLRHVRRLHGQWSVQFWLSGKPDRVATPVFQGPSLDNVTSVHIVGQGDLTYWLKEMASPNTSLCNVTHLSLWGRSVADADLAVLARSDSGFKALKKVSLYGTSVTDAGVTTLQCARPEVVVSK